MPTYEQQLADVQQLSNPSHSSDNDSIDSVLSPVKILNKNIMQLACKRWRSLPDNIIKSWKHRVEWLKSHPLPGRFAKIPAEVMEQHSKQSMTRHWEKIVKGMKYAITRGAKKILSSKMYYFGKECVKINSQTFRAVSINLLIQLALFGDDLSKLMNYEIISKSKNMTIIHMSSQLCAAKTCI